MHGSLPLIPTEKDRANIRIFYNSFSDTLDTSYLSLAASDRLSSWIGHTQSSHLYTSAVNGALDVFKDVINDTNDPDPRTGSTLSEIGILTPTQTYECSNPALERYLRSRLIAALPVPSPPRPIGSRRPAQRTREDTRKVSLGSWAWPFGSRPSTPAGDNAVHGRAGEQSLGGVPAGASGSARTSIDTSRGSLNGPATVSPQAAVVGVGAEQKSTWLGLGTVPSAIGGAVGSMGTIFGLRSHDAAKPSTIKASELFPEAAQPAGNEAGKPHFTPGAESASAGQAPGADDKTMRDTLDTQSIRSVLEPSVPLSELADAQTDQRSIAAQVDWEGRDFYLGENGWRRVEWTVVGCLSRILAGDSGGSDPLASRTDPISARAFYYSWSTHHQPSRAKRARRRLHSRQWPTRTSCRSSTSSAVSSHPSPLPSRRHRHPHDTHLGDTVQSPILPYGHPKA